MWKCYTSRTSLKKLHISPYISFTHFLHFSFLFSCRYLVHPLHMSHLFPAGEACRWSHLVSNQQHLRVSKWRETHSVQIFKRSPLIPPSHYHPGTLLLTDSWIQTQLLEFLTIELNILIHIPKIGNVHLSQWRYSRHWHFTQGNNSLVTRDYLLHAKTDTYVLRDLTNIL